MSDLPVPIPPVNPETKAFWDATREHRLVVPRCAACGETFWYPRFLCPLCGSTDVTLIPASGRGTVYSFTITRRGQDVYEKAVPYVLAYVELAEGPRMMTNLVECDLTTLRCGMPVEVVFHDASPDAALPRFRPASA